MKYILIIIFGMGLLSCSAWKKAKAPADLSQYDVKEYPDSTRSLLTGFLHSENNDPLIFASIAVFKDGEIFTGTEANFDGEFSIELLPGTYDIEFQYVGFSTHRIEGVILKGGSTLHIIKGLKQKERYRFFGCGGYEIPLIDMSNPSSGQTFTDDQIHRFAGSRP